MAKQQRARRAKPEPGNAAPSQTVMSERPNRQLVVFRIANEQLALPLESTAEIIRPPVMARMPLGPEGLLGLANLRGTILPVVSLRRLLGFADQPHDDMARVIVVAGATPVGFAVDRIENLMSVEAENVGDGNLGAGTIDPAFVDGVVKVAEGLDTIKILEPNKLLQREFSGLNTPHRRTNVPTIAVNSLAASAVTPDQLAFVSFDLGRQEYAVPLEAVTEIIPLPDHVAEVARSEDAVLGVVTLRDRLLPIVSLRALLGMTGTEERARGKVVVLSMGETHVGVVADATREILRLDASFVDPAPALLTRGAGDAEITSICRLDGGKRLVAVLSPDRLFRSELMQRVMAKHEPSQVLSDVQLSGRAMTQEQFVVVRLGAQEYGIPIAAVDEIARLPENLTKLPKAPAFIDGVINLRGSVVPIVDLRRRFDLPSSTVSTNRRVLILSVSGSRTGFIVDDVSEVIKIDASTIQTAPDLSPEQMRLIGRVANLNDVDRMILLVDPAQLLNRVETEVLEKFARRQPEKTLSHS